ncbi:MAG: flagellar biosynthesis/type III secretory pathway protein [Desulfobacula sp.]|uniref:FliH/SctL family protein n=1 Tax=Desulfobacula sp. TaxID=2593537 RepID=UPI0025C34EC1|nr:FliH/SctL family protein [Desulfobacula sp.]MCD4722759.1 flagellar biosynthesis/type III secretory pathway protein [Desulfobacula sp.]
MSLSDIDDEKFKPIDLSSLESFDEEHSNDTDKSKPDFDRFEMLFEKPKFEKEESYNFEAMYDVKKEEVEIVFKPLIESNDDPFEKDEEHKARKDIKGNEAFEKQEELKETPEKKGYRAGFEKGLEKGIEQGIEQGQKQGYEEGFKKGEAQGLEKGEQQGFEKGEQQGFEKGQKEGEEKATKETREKAVEILNSLEDSLKTADSTLELLVEKYEERIISLIQQIAQKTVIAQIEMNDEIVKAMILEALKMLVQPEEVVLSVSLDDYEYVEMIKDEFFEAIDSLTNVSIRSDASIKRGGCKIDTITASISADPESRLEAIFEAIKKAGTA